MWPLCLDELEANFQLTTSIVCNNLETRIFFALQGLGIAYLPDYAIGQYLVTGRLAHVLAHCSENDTIFRIMWPSGKHLAPKLRVFIDFLSERLFPNSNFNGKTPPP